MNIYIIIFIFIRSTRSSNTSSPSRDIITIIIIVSIIIMNSLRHAIPNRTHILFASLVFEHVHSS